MLDDAFLNISLLRVLGLIEKTFLRMYADN